MQTSGMFVWTLCRYRMRAALLLLLLLLTLIGIETVAGGKNKKGEMRWPCLYFMFHYWGCSRTSVCVRVIFSVALWSNTQTMHVKYLIKSLFCCQRKANPRSLGQNAPTGAMETVSLATGTVGQGLERGHVTSRPWRWNVKYLASGSINCLEVTHTQTHTPVQVGLCVKECLPPIRTFVLCSEA